MSLAFLQQVGNFPVHEEAMAKRVWWILGISERRITNYGRKTCSWRAVSLRQL